MLILRNYTRFKVSGHIFFWLASIAFAVLSFYVASQYQLKLNLNLFIRAIVPNMGFALAVYINLYLLIPRFLKNKNYIFYTFWLIVLLSLSSVFVQLALIFLLKTGSIAEQFSRMFSWHFFTALFYVLVTSLFKFAKDWLQMQEMNLKFSQIEREKLEAELKTLKAQLNPHFLFNCLNNIYALALTGSPKTPETVLRLSDLMRHVLYESREDFVPLQKELDFLINFLELQKIRLDKKVDIRFEVDEPTPAKKIIPLIFEPFVDNAFKHGLKNPAEEPFIHVSIKFQENKLYFTVSNNYLSERASGNKFYSGIGLKNIEKRLKFLYAEHEYQFNVEQTDHTFTVRLEVLLK